MKRTYSLLMVGMLLALLVSACTSSAQADPRDRGSFNVGPRDGIRIFVSPRDHGRRGDWRRDGRSQERWGYRTGYQSGWPYGAGSCQAPYVYPSQQAANDAQRIYENAARHYGDGGNYGPYNQYPGYGRR